MVTKKAIMEELKGAWGHSFEKQLQNLREADFKDFRKGVVKFLEDMIEALALQSVAGIKFTLEERNKTVEAVAMGVKKNKNDHLQFNENITELLKRLKVLEYATYMGVIRRKTDHGEKPTRKECKEIANFFSVNFEDMSKAIEGSPFLGDKGDRIK